MSRNVSKNALRDSDKVARHSSDCPGLTIYTEYKMISYGPRFGHCFVWTAAEFQQTREAPRYCVQHLPVSLEHHGIRILPRPIFI